MKNTVRTPATTPVAMPYGDDFEFAGAPLRMELQRLLIGDDAREGRSFGAGLV